MKFLFPFFVAILLSTGCSYFYNDPFELTYTNHCTACHGKELEGGPQGPALIGKALTNGESVDELIQSINKGYPEKGMPAFKEALSERAIRKLAIFIAEKREGTSMANYNVAKGEEGESLKIPTQLVPTKRTSFRLQEVAAGLEPWPFSIEPMPGRNILLTEKRKGLRIISPEGKLSNYIKGTPKTYEGVYEESTTKLIHGLGWMHDVALHPDYSENGWIYLSFGDRCKDCNEIGGDVSMLKLIRGRISEGNWTDEEVVWETAKENYQPTPETPTGGRICFDQKGHVFLSSGARLWRNKPEGVFESIWGIQNKALPYGKIFRLNMDGSIPEDNPYVGDSESLGEIWTIGHRSPEGLEYDTLTGQLWGTEMGPRGGDEVNLLIGGENYGWPLTSKGLNYDGTSVSYSKILGVDIDLETLIQPVVDLTPSPAVSSFVVYRGGLFPEWDGDLIVGSLKAATLYRFRTENGQLLERETLISDLGRIRDIEIDADGSILLLLEHIEGAKIVRMLPENIGS
ncbi:MAG: PQQ-dependent sugar dehydrogenase [Bacteroidota bacterium]